MREVEWVSIELFDKNWNVLLIEEWENKSWKNKGQISTPMGTVEEEEKEKYLETLIRELEEEIWLILDNKDKEKIEENWEFVLYVEDKEKWKIKVFIKKFRLKIDDVLKEKIDLNLSNKEITRVFWENKENLKNENIENLRPWTVETLLKEKEEENKIWVVFIKNWKYHKNTYNWVKNDLQNI